MNESPIAVARKPTPLRWSEDAGRTPNPVQAFFAIPGGVIHRTLREGGPHPFWLASGASVRGFPGRGQVAVHMLWSAVPRAVCVVVSEVPLLAAGDEVLAAPAWDGACCYSRHPVFAECDVCCVVAALRPAASGLLVLGSVCSAPAALAFGV